MQRCIRVTICQTFQAVKRYTHISMSLRPLVFSGPSGSGKSTLVKKLMADNKDIFAFSVSHTTRNPRPGEMDGKEYHFVERNKMLNAIENGDFIEHAEFSSNLYGTSKKAVEDVKKTGRICILDIDMQGVKSIKETKLNPLYIFIKPPSLTVLEERLRSRGTEKEDAIRKRMDIAKAEVEYGDMPGAYDHVILNDDLDVAYAKLKGILSQDIEHVASLKDH